jgi:APA family basic amino acid/polyamine antiporter
VTCILGALICGSMMVSLGTPTWIRLVVWTAVGTVVYLGYGRKHSRVRATMNGSTGKAKPVTTA